MGCGMGRVMYALGIVATVVFATGAAISVSPPPADLLAPGAGRALMQFRGTCLLFGLPFLIWMSWDRAKSIGWHGAMSLLLLVPFANVVVLAFLLFKAPKPAMAVPAT